MEDLADYFKHNDTAFRMARWQRAISPVVFGGDDATLGVFKGAIEAICKLANHPIEETDPEQGANLLFFLFRDWPEVLAVPDIEKLVPGLGEKVLHFAQRGTNQYRHFRFEENGAIRAAFVFIRVDQIISEQPAEELALAHAAQVITLWGPAAFAKRSPLARLPDDKGAVLRPDIAALIQAIYDPVMPVASEDPAQALRLSARVGQTT